MADGACLGGEDPSPLVDFLEPPLGYNKSFNGAEWMCGCSSFVTESGSYKTDQDGCSSVDLLGLDKCGFCRGRGSYMVLTNSGKGVCMAISVEADWRHLEQLAWGKVEPLGAGQSLATQGNWAMF
ncbi:hypothetical protein V6N12_000616 [Hibiscus sabdariffa]|uniref:Uncharacterized protein n=1 Tax=Hibiscus sabdariffa TaxID=183260 RepID=A0ABR2B984_9ROSI